MKKIFSFLTIVVIFSTAIFIFNGCEYVTNSNDQSIKSDYPIILVHGFNAWGRDEFVIWKVPPAERQDNPMSFLWRLLHIGGNTDLQTELRNQGHEVHTVAVGPFSSNWDRACEMYAQLKNLPKVDYGEVHSRKYGHRRFVDNKTYNDSVTKIILKNGWDKDNKIHLVTHSMGASTARLLLNLLEHGDNEETALKNNPDYPNFKISPLFDNSTKGINSGMIKSITTIAGVNNGATIMNSLILNINGLLKIFGYDLDKLNAPAAAIQVFSWINYNLYSTKDGTIEHPFYDLKMEQWGIEKEEGDTTWEIFWDRVKTSPAFKSRDLSFFDLTPEGMIVFNGKIPAEPHVYYFSYTTNQTEEYYNLFYWYINNGYIHGGNKKMTPLMKPLAHLMGIYTAGLNFKKYGGNADITDEKITEIMAGIGNMKIDARWLANDGTVNTFQAKYPMINSSDKCSMYDDSINNYKPQQFAFDKEIKETGFYPKFDKCTGKTTEMKPGVWYYLGQIDSDHYDIIGLGGESYYENGKKVYGPYYNSISKPRSQSLIDFYSDLAKFVNKLP